MRNVVETGTNEITPAALSGSPLMLAKLDIPPPPPRILLRTRLVDAIAVGVMGSLTVVCAPAGSGKTTLMLSWLSSSRPPGPVVWLSLDGWDRQPGVFWSYLLTGLSRAGVSITEVEQPTGVQVSRSFLVQLAVALYQRTEPVVVVLDDADVLVDSAVSDQLDFVLRNAGGALRLVILARDEPAVQLPRHRLAGSITEIRAAELAATPEEAQALLKLHEVDLPSETLDELMGRTRGWMAGVVLLGLALHDRPDLAGQPLALAGVGGDIDVYLDEEVLRGYPPSTRRFLLQTSIADHLPSGLAEELTGQPGAPRLLSRLARGNAFVSRCEHHTDCYQYHPLFRHMLRERLSEDAPGAVPQLHRRASAWFTAANEPAEAAVHAAAAAEWGAAVRILVHGLAIPRLREGPGSGRLAWVLSDLPAETPDAESAIVFAAIALARRDATGCAWHLARARELAAQTPPEGSGAVALGICIVASGLATLTGDVEAALSTADAVEVLRRELPDSDPVRLAWALVLRDTGEALLRAGRLQVAATVLTKAQEAFPASCDHPRGTCDGALALAEALRGRLRRATELAGPEPEPHAGAAARRAPAAEVALAWVGAETGDSDLARRHLLAVPATGPNDPLFTAVAALVRARLHLADGDPAGAVALIDRARWASEGPPMPAWLDVRLAAAAARTWTVTGRPDLASRYLVEATATHTPELALELAWLQLARGAEPTPAIDVLRHADLPLDLRVDAWLLRAAQSLESGDIAAARASADRALRAAAPERLRRPIMQAGARLQGFLRGGELAAVHGWLNEARPAIAVRAPEAIASGHSARPVLIEPLTEKEHEVLVNLAELLSTEEIARAMFVSVNTVRTHVRAILRKLAASRRNEAIRRARELGII